MSPQRVGAILSQNKGIVKFLGYGQYVGNVACERLGGMPNPKIELDSGETVWGCECWWGPEEKIKTVLTGAVKVENVSIDQVRTGIGNMEI